MASGGYSRLIKAATVVTGAYGLFLGLSEPPRPIKSRAQAEDQGNILHLGPRIGLDTGLALADDLLAVPALYAAGRLFPRVRPYVKPGIAGVMTVGTGIVGAIAGYDIANYMEARRALSNDNTIPDSRISAIEGFQSRGAGYLIRRSMTGIASPAAQAIYHNMRHNPFADLMRVFIPGGVKGDYDFSDMNSARTVTGATVAGGLIANTMTLHMGFGISSLFGLAGGIGAGLLAAHAQGATDPEAVRSANASIFNYAWPILGTLGAIAGARHLRFAPGILGKAGGAVDRGLSNFSGALGRFAARGKPRTGAFFDRAGIGMARAHAGALGWGGGPLGSAVKWLGLQMGMADLRLSTYLGRRPLSGDNPGSFYATKMAGALGATISGANTLGGLGLGVSRGAIQNVFWPMLEHTGTAHNRLEQNLALSHLVIMAPHMAMMAHQTVSGTASIPGSRRRSHATASMPSNIA